MPFSLAQAWRLLFHDEVAEVQLLLPMARCDCRDGAAAHLAHPGKAFNQAT